jgi:hypothetical protein
MDTLSGSTESGVRIDLYVRSLSPRESRRQIEHVVERLERLVADSVLAEYRLIPTGAELPATPDDAVTEYGEFLLHRIGVFEDWAAANGRSLGKLFERRTVFSRFTDEEHDAVSMPTMVMAEYDGTSLRFVAPCQDGAERVSVLDRLDALAMDDDVESGEQLAGAGVRSPPGPSTQAK